MRRRTHGVISVAVILTVAGAVIAAPPIWEPSFGTELGLTDDSTTSRTFTSLNFSFPFVGTTYTGSDELWISSNGFISLGVDNGSDCCAGDPALLVAEGPRIAAFWADHSPNATAGNDVYINAFNDDGDPENDRVVITWNDLLFDNNQPILAQIQLRDDGTVVLGYDGYDLTGFNDNTLIGLSPGGGVGDPGSTDLTASMPFNTGTEPTVYELFIGTPPPIDVDQTNVVFVPNGQGGWGVDVPVELQSFSVD
jgi:hypothetical protein